MIGRFGRGPISCAPAGDWSILVDPRRARRRQDARRRRDGARLGARLPLVNLIGATRQDAREIMVEGESGVLAVCPPHERPRFARASDRLEWPNGAVSQIFSAEEPDRLRGKQHMKLWLDELAAWRDPDAFDQAMLGLRLGAQAAGGHHHDAAPDAAHQAIARRSRRRRHARLDLRQSRNFWPTGS